MNDISKIVEQLNNHLNQSKSGKIRRKFKSIFNSTHTEEEILSFNSLLKNLDIDCNPIIQQSLNPDSWLEFGLDKKNVIKEVVVPKIVINNDLYSSLFQFDSKEEFERFNACLSGYQPVGLFLIPTEEDFFNPWIEKILSMELSRKRYYLGDNKIGEIQYLEAARVTDSDGNGSDDTNWYSADIFHFAQATLRNVLLGQSAWELIHSEKFERKLNQLSLYASRQFNNPFFVIFHCPPLQLLEKSGRLSLLDNLYREVSKRFPFVFKLHCPYPNESAIPDEVKEKIQMQMRLMLEVPNYPSKYQLSLIEYLAELQQVSHQAENHIFLKMDPSVFSNLIWRYENDEYAYLQYLVVDTLKNKYKHPLKNIKCDASITRTLKDGYEYTANADVLVNNDVLVIIETFNRKSTDKNVYLNISSTLRDECRAWDKSLKEFWLVVSGYEVARNLRYIQKVLEIISKEISKRKMPKPIIRLLVPDFQNTDLIEVDWTVKEKKSLEITVKSNFDIPTISGFKSEEGLKFSNVKGLREEKAILKDLINLQKDNHYLGLGGILFYGLPGCGKTYLSQAFANELGRNFFSFSPADIQSVWLGQSQKNVKDIFNQAKSKNPSLLFLDELDSIGFSRNEPNAHTDQKATINQLLLELNNIDEQDTIIVAATNRLSSLDTALKRSGRFDLKIPIFPPNIVERSEIFQYYIENLNKELLSKNKEKIDLEDYYFNYASEIGVGLTSSDIKLIVNKLRINILLNKPKSYEKDTLIRIIQKFIEEGQRTLRKEDVRSFVTECEQNDNDSPKLEFLRVEWNL